MTMSRWYVSSGPEGARRYVSDVVDGPDGPVVAWCDILDAALRFGTREEAFAVARVVATAGQTVAAIPLDPS